MTVSNIKGMDRLGFIYYTNATKYKPMSFQGFRTIDLYKNNKSTRRPKASVGLEEKEST